MTRGPLLHADADAFFVSVALRDRPDLAGAPVAVASVVVACASYPARAVGVRAGMTVQEARHRCPDLVLLDLPQDRIEEAGEALLDLFQRFARAVEPGSIEEAFLDLTDRSWDEAVLRAEHLRRAAAQELGLPVTVGVGRTKLMAKLASRAGKPDGLHVIDPAQEPTLRRDLPLGQVWGVGERTVSRLAEVGVHRLGDLDRVSRLGLRRWCGTTMAARLHRIREGTDDAVVKPVRSRRTLTASGSIAGYDRPDRTPEDLARECVRRVCHRADRAGLVGSTLVLSPTPVEGRLPQRRATLPSPTVDEAEWWSVAAHLLAQEPLPPLADLSVTLSGLLPAVRVQPTLF